MKSFLIVYHYNEDPFGDWHSEDAERLQRLQIAIGKFEDSIIWITSGKTNYGAFVLVGDYTVKKLTEFFTPFFDLKFDVLVILQHETGEAEIRLPVHVRTWLEVQVEHSGENA